MVAAWGLCVFRTNKITDESMRIVLIVAAGLGLASCSSASSMSDLFKSTPPQVSLQLDSTPPGADAVTSVGPGCKTPCTVTVPASENFTVTYNLAKYQSATVPINVVAQSGAAPILDPNPATVELVAAAPVKKQAKKKPRVARAPKAAPDAAPAGSSDGSASPFPPVR
jgi:hypothetical protein